MSQTPAPPPTVDTTPSDALTPTVRGVEVIRQTLRTLPDSPGVYRMLNGKGDALYVGKAKSLKKRVVAYTRIDALPLRLQRMVSETISMEIVTTHTEAEALLLESNLIKTLKPRYNILLRDDKSFPYLVLTSADDFPQVIKHRGSKSLIGDYFGPFASAGAVNQTLNQIQKAFLLRSCTDAVFNSRTRPCLLHQIKRCSAPCVDRISRADYQTLVTQAKAFLSGDSKEIQAELATRMEAHSAAMEFEDAAILRDRIRALAQVQAHQDIAIDDMRDADVIAIHQAGGQSCLQVFFFRMGQNYGNRAYFPQHSPDAPSGEVLEAFVGQFYANKLPPHSILLSEPLPNHDLVCAALNLRAGRKVDVTVPKRGPRTKAIAHALTNAREALGRRLAESSAQNTLLVAMAELFELDGPPQRIEVYDNSHIQGTNMVGGMIVAGPEGFNKSAYRKFNIKDPTVTPGNDFAMMREVLTRRFTRAQKEDPDRDRGQWPDVVLIDGGQGQFNVAKAVLDDLAIDDVTLIGIAKGPDRNAGRETYFSEGREPFTLAHNHPVHYFLQRLRDEAHRFAIGSHRARRSQDISRSPLDGLPGIGPKRKKALLHAFGSARGVAEAGLTDLQQVDGISESLAQTIYDHFHG
ncbi:excinuclease ABC subunit UvrC [Insolitispirillum peregrinum]|uniref:excinuclease ABC subunit UvrC n=1 Tax=Insolitispirillum peregrinum TaxID=80876 RepID=UPI0036060C63